MRHNTKYLAAIMAMAALLSCSKTEEPQDGQITFGSDLIVTKASPIINNTAQLRTLNKIYAYGKQGSNVIFNDEELSFNSSTSKWMPAASKTWVTNTAYTFWGWACSPSTARSNTAANGNLTVSNNGTTFTVNQPSSYIEENMVDMLLSYKVEVSEEESAHRPLVQLHMEHAMPMVDIYAVKTSGIESAIVDQLTLSNVYNSATYSINTHHVNGAVTETNNIWQVTFTVGSQQNTVYELNDTFDPTTATGGYEVAVEEENTEATMHIMTVAQPISLNTTLYIHYWVNEKVAGGADNYVEHEATFRLSDSAYGLSRWRNGCRTVYRITIDTGIHLSAQIKEWTHIDYIEGTLLP